MTYIKELTPDLVGKKISCKIEGTFCKEATIQKEERGYYICQNEKNGSDCKDKLGYRYSWTVESGSATALLNDRVTEIKLLKFEERDPLLDNIGISRVLTIDDMLTGQYYHVKDENSDSFLIIRNDGLRADSSKVRIKGPLIGNFDSSPGEWEYQNEEMGGCWIPERPVRLATPEEVKWLNQCIKEGKSISIPLSVVEQTVPEYIDHRDVEKGEYYVIDHFGDNENSTRHLMRCDSQDDEHRWSGPGVLTDLTNNAKDFEDGDSEDDGAYFGGDPTIPNFQTRVRKATPEERAWLDACIVAGEVVEKPQSYLMDNVEVKLNYPGTITKEEILEKLKELLTQNKEKSMEKYITVLHATMIGKTVKCRIEGARVSQGKITYDRDAFYILNDVKDSGSISEGKKEKYKCAWKCGHGTTEELQAVGVSALEIIPFPEFEEGDYVLILDGQTSDMKKYIGKIARIGTKLTDVEYRIDLDRENYTWSTERNELAPATEVKIITSIEEMKTGDIFIYKNNYMGKAEIEGRNLKIKPYINVNAKEYGRYSSLTRPQNAPKGSYRTVTPLERAHFEVCEKAGKYVEPPKSANPGDVSMQIAPEVLIEMILNNA